MFDTRSLIPGLDKLLEHVRHSGAETGAEWLQSLVDDEMLTIVRLQCSCEISFAKRALDAAVARRLPVLAVLHDGSGAGPAASPCASFVIRWARAAAVSTVPGDVVACALAAAGADVHGLAVLVETTCGARDAWNARIIAAGRFPMAIRPPAPETEATP